jgi:hypothetical protein
LNPESSILRFLLSSIAVLQVACACCRAQTVAAPNERGLWALWKQHTENTNRHAQVADACAAFEKASPQDPLRVVARGIAAWHLLKSGKNDAARQILLPMLADRGTDLAKAGSDIARRWMTRLDREDVRGALKEVYNRDIAFPESLEALKTLPADRRPPPADRWGKPWEYKLVGFKALRGLPNQKYELISQLLGPESDLRAALADPYAARINLKPSRLVSPAGQSEVVEFVTDGEPVARKQVMSVGSTSERIVFPYSGQNLILLSDGDCWKVLPKPRR